jgi:hypothetical protein
MSETIEQLCQRIMEERGYLVIYSPHNRKPGDIVPSLDVIGDDRLEQKTVVIAETSEAEYLEQSLQYGRDSYYPPWCDRFYRVIAE